MKYTQNGNATTTKAINKVTTKSTMSLFVSNLVSKKLNRQPMHSER
jgi:hypothetical protein